MKNENYLKELKKDFDDLNKSVDSLNLSFNKCRKIGVKNTYNFEEQESFVKNL